MLWVVLTTRILALFVIWISAALLLAAKTQRQQRRQLRVEHDLILHGAGIGIFVIKRGRIVQANKYITDLYGWPAEELIGAHPAQFFPDRESAVPWMAVRW